jgi:N-acetylmuramoyl-L-alanine amidase
MSVAQMKPTDVTILAVHSFPTKDNLTVIDIDRLQRAQGYIRIGYHYVIRKDGTLEKGRPLTQRGNHLLGKNYCSVGICLVGSSPTVQQREALDGLLVELLASFPGAVVQDFTP